MGLANKNAGAVLSGHVENTSAARSAAEPLVIIYYYTFQYGLLDQEIRKAKKPGEWGDNINGSFLFAQNLMMFSVHARCT